LKICDKNLLLLAWIWVSDNHIKIVWACLFIRIDLFWCFHGCVYFNLTVLLMINYSICGSAWVTLLYHNEMIWDEMCIFAWLCGFFIAFVRCLYVATCAQLLLGGVLLLFHVLFTFAIFSFSGQIWERFQDVGQAHCHYVNGET
jgi:hypothetical protein